MPQTIPLGREKGGGGGGGVSIYVCEREREYVPQKLKRELGEKS